MELNFVLGRKLPQQQTLLNKVWHLAKGEPLNLNQILARIPNFSNKLASTHYYPDQTLNVGLWAIVG